MDTGQVAGQPQAETDGPLVLALDIGTSSTRAMLFDARGIAVQGKAAQTRYQMRLTPGGGVEADADALVEVAAVVIDEVLRESGTLAERIVAVGTSCFWHSLVAVAPDSRPLTPVYTWADDRSAAAVDALRGILDETVVHDRTGCVIHTSYWPAKLRWLAETQPELASDGGRWVGFGEYLLSRFTGSLACSVSMASGSGLLNQHTADWDHTLLGQLGVDPARLPELIDRDEALPPLRDEWAVRWPSLARVPWFPAIGDGACNNIGSGCVVPGRMALSIGTSGVMRVTVEADEVAIPPQLWCYRIDRRRYLLGGALSNGGVVADWLNSTLHLPDDAAEQVAALAPDAHGLTILPFLAGQRTPDWNPHATATFLGLTVETTPVAIMRAGMEAVAYRFALVHELLRPLAPDPYEIIVSGGAIGHWPVWPQIIADAIGHPLVASLEPEASARGAALVALAGAGVIPDLDELPDHLGPTYKPQPAAHATYAAARARLERYHTLLR